MAEISVKTALTAFLADRREHSSQRQFHTAEKVISSLRRSIAKDADQPTGDIPASQVTGHIAHLVVEARCLSVSGAEAGRAVCSTQSRLSADRSSDVGIRCVCYG